MRRYIRERGFPVDRQWGCIPYSNCSVSCGRRAALWSIGAAVSGEIGIPASAMTDSFTPRWMVKGKKKRSRCLFRSSETDPETSSVCILNNWAIFFLRSNTAVDVLKISSRRLKSIFGQLSAYSINIHQQTIKMAGFRMTVLITIFISFMLYVATCHIVFICFSFKKTTFWQLHKLLL